MQLTPTEIAEVMRALDMQAEPDHADLAFVFGTRLREPADLAVQAFQRGIVPYIVLTGGANRTTGVVEARAHSEILVQAGIPLDRIIIEDESTNTLENVVFALPKIAACLDLAAIHSILVIAKWYACRRAIMTLRRHLPAGIRYYPCSYEPPGITRDSWYKNEESRDAVLRNWRVIPTYFARGHLAEVRREGDAYV